MGIQSLIRLGRVIELLTASVVAVRLFDRVSCSRTRCARHHIQVCIQNGCLRSSTLRGCKKSQTLEREVICGPSASLDKSVLRVQTSMQYKRLVHCMYTTILGWLQLVHPMSHQVTYYLSIRPVRRIEVFIVNDKPPAKTL